MEPSSISGSKIWDEQKPRIIQRVFSSYFPGSRNLQRFGFQKVDKVETLQRSSKKRARTINPARIPAKIAQLRRHRLSMMAGTSLKRERSIMDNSVTRIDDRRRRVVSHRQIQVTHAGLELASRAFRLIEIIARILLSPFYPPVRRVRREIPFLFCPESWIIDHPRARDAMNPRRRLHKLRLPSQISTARWASVHGFLHFTQLTRQNNKYGFIVAS